MSNEVQFRLKLERTTKGAALYKNVRNGEAVTNLYLRKDHLPEPVPSEITVTVDLGGG